MSQKEMVCGFLFDAVRIGVVLIEKKRPAWQRGRWNGVGGHIEEGESPNEAMVREFEEETGRKIRAEYWNPLITLWTPKRKEAVFFFYAFSNLARGTKSMTDEIVRLFGVDMLPSTCLPNLHWLIPLALDRNVTRGREVIRITIPAQVEAGDSD